MRLFDMDSREDYLLNGRYKVATPYAPLVDVVEVVRCRYCKYSQPADDYQDGYYCNHPSHNREYLVFSRSYCSYGERRN